MIYTKTGSGAGPIEGLIAFGRSSSRYINLYSVRQLILAPSLLPSQPTDFVREATDVAWSGSAEYLVCAVKSGLGEGGAFRFFTRSGLSLSGQTVPNTFNSFTGGRCAISADGSYAAATSFGIDVPRIWHNSSGTLTRLTSVGTFSSSTRACAVSSNGSYAAFFSSQDTLLRIKVRSGSGDTATYSDMSLASQPASGASGGDLAFSPDDVYLAVAPNNQNNQTVYKFNAGTSVYEQLAGPFVGSLPDAGVVACIFSAQGDLLALATGSKTFFYERAGDTFTNVANVSGGERGGFHPSGNFYITGSGQIYRKNSASSWSAVGSALQSNGVCSAFSPYII